jgi:hypothetical protein
MDSRLTYRTVWSGHVRAASCRRREGFQRERDAKSGLVEAGGMTTVINSFQWW